MPSNSHAVDKPDPEPNSRKRPPGLLPASILNNEPVNGSDNILKPMAWLSAMIG